ncbi:MAG: PHP domain-containing protein, partial [Clostridia bacterium]|nr:PHP domain-containing protein [Clostridia bacterium]
MMKDPTKKLFTELFFKYKPGSEDLEILDLLEDYTYRLNKETREIRIDFYLPRLIPKFRLYAIEEAIRQAYDLTSCFIFPKYASELFDPSYQEELLLELARNTKLAKGFFDDCVMKQEDDSIIFEMKAGYDKLPHGGECERLLEEIIFSEFGIRKNVSFQAEEFDIAEYNRRQSFTMLFDDVVKSVPSEGASAPSFGSSSFQKAEFDENGEYPTSLGDDTEFSFDRENMIVRAGYCTFDLKEPQEIFGRKWKEEDLDTLHPIRDFSSTPGPVSFCGRFLSQENKEMRGKDGFRVKVHITDGASSITVKVSGSTEKVKSLMKAAPGTPLFVVGNLMFDQFENELIVKPRSVFQIKEIPMTDTAEEKRIELHLHTKMSTMDATIETKDIVKLAHSWGHRAVAITDHGNLQGFPDAMLTAEALGMKIIYGMEGYFVDDTARALFGEAHGDFDTTEFVIFDIETTGLSPLSCQITEIGAVLYKNGEVLDRFSTFADPGEPIPQNIVELTGITDEMVKGAPSPLEAVKAFLEFAGDRLLIAHNANFDMGFIKKVAEDHELPLPNPYLDTLALSRFLNPDLKKHKLDTLQEYFGLEDFNHH